MCLEGQSANIFSASVLTKISAVIILKKLTLVVKEKEFVIV